jgi:hypothetical protein
MSPGKARQVNAFLKSLRMDSEPLMYVLNPDVGRRVAQMRSCLSPFPALAVCQSPDFSNRTTGLPIDILQRKKIVSVGPLNAAEGDFAAPEF